MRSFCFEIIYGILLIVQKGHSTPDGQRVALNVRPLQPKRFFLAKPAVQTEGAEYAGAWFYDYTHQNGVVKFYSKEVPAADISTCIILFGKGGGGESDLTVATREQLGHVKIGNGIEVTEDGTISANAKVSEDQIATSDDTSEMLKEIYGE